MMSSRYSEAEERVRLCRKIFLYSSRRASRNTRRAPLAQLRFNRGKIYGSGVIVSEGGSVGVPGGGGGGVVTLE